MNQASCLDCPARYTCSNGLINPCPAGSYCEAETETGNDQKCPAGTWSNQERLATSDECMICPAGFMCDIEGINSVQLWTKIINVPLDIGVLVVSMSRLALVQANLIHQREVHVMVATLENVR